MTKNTKVTDAKIMYAVLVMLNSRGPLNGSEIKERVLEALITRTDYKNAGYLKSKKQVGTQEHIWEITDKGIKALEMELDDIDLYEKARMESKAQYDAKE